jgi:hypothetical protein
MAADYASYYPGESEFQAASAPWGGRLADLLAFICRPAADVWLRLDTNRPLARTAFPSIRRGGRTG